MARRSWGALLVRATLAGLLAAEVTGVAIARSDGVVRSEAAQPAPIVADATRPARDVRVEIRRGPAAETRRDPIAQPPGPGRTIPTAANLRPPPRGLASPARSITTAAAARSSSAAPSPSSGQRAHAVAAATAYRGRNHVWVPALGINRSVQAFSCSRPRPPDAGVYRWGCAGRNNVYLMSHAWSAFKPLHDAYVRGRLRKGMQVWYADGAGRVHRYSVIWWRVTAPTTAASWA